MLTNAFDLNNPIYTSTSSECTLCSQQHKIESCPLVTNEQHIFDKKVPSRAWLTIPNELKIVNMSDGTVNVVAQAPIPVGIKFGPYEAKIKRNLLPDIFPIKVFKQNENEDEYYFDPADKNVANWMCFVAPASEADEQNLICYQVERKIYFSTIKNISVGEFLKVWYAPFYAKKMGASILEYEKSLPSKPNKDNAKQLSQKLAESLPAKSLGAKETSVSSWNCKFCNVTIDNVVKFSLHLEHHYKELAAKISICSICNNQFKSEQVRILDKHKLDCRRKTTNLIETETTRNNESGLTNDNTTIYLENCFKTTEMPKHNSKIPNNGSFSFANKVAVTDALVGGQQQDQIENNSLLDNIALSSLNYSQEIINNVMLSKIADISDDLRFDIKDTADLGDSLNPDTLHDILCEDDTKASKIAQEKSIADFSLDFVESNGLNLSSGDTVQTSPRVVCRTEVEIEESECLEKPPYTCDICQKTFEKAFYLIRHLKKHSGEFTCINCYAVFGRKENLNNHFCTWDQKIPDIHECENCDMKFTELKYYKRHMKRHTLESNCVACGKCFKTDAERKWHSCDPKDRQNIEKNQMRKKKSKDSSNDGHSQICFVCGLLCPRLSILKAHLVSHQPKNFSCDICSRQFHRVDRWKTHMLSHEKPSIECTVCHKMLKTQKSLTLHMKLHNGDSEFSCDICQKSFTQNCNLQKHMMKFHSQENVFEQTKLCNDSRQNDIKSNKGKLPNISVNTVLRCRFCNKKFTEKTALKTHQEEHHCGETFTCPYCSTVVKYRASIRRHLNKAHRDKSEEWDKASFIKSLTSQKLYVNGQIGNFIRTENLSEINENENSPPINTQVNVLNENTKNDTNADSNSISKNYLSDLLAQMDTTQLFNENQLELQNIICMKNSDDNSSIAISPIKNITYENLQSEIASNGEVYSSDTTNSGRPPDFEMLDIQSFINTDGDLINFSNELNTCISTEDHSVETSPENCDLQNISTNSNINTSENILPASETDKEVTLGKDAYILEDGTIVAPQEAGNIVLYVLCS